MSLLETATLKLKTISPIHIKGKDLDYGQGFVRRNQDTAYAIDSDALGTYLYEVTGNLDLVSKYVDEIETYARRRKLKEYDFENFLSSAGIYHHERNRSREIELINAGVFRAIVNATSETQFIRDGLGRPFLPGSSLKGVLRTAVLCHMIKSRLEEREPKRFIDGIRDRITEFENETKGQPDKMNQARQVFSRSLQQYIFQNRMTGIKAHSDFFRCVKVKDSTYLNELQNCSVAVFTLKSPAREATGPDAPGAARIENATGILVLEQEAVRVRYHGMMFDFKERVYRKNLELLRQSIGSQIRIIEAGGDKINTFEILESAVPPVTRGREENEIFSLTQYPIQFKLDAQNNRVMFEVETFEGSTESLITLDHSILDYFTRQGYKIPFSSLEQLFQLLVHFSSQVWQAEKNFFALCNNKGLDPVPLQDFYRRSERSNKLRMGWGTGLTGMTIDLLLEEEMFREFRDRIFVNRQGMPAPKSRRLLFENEELNQPLGWAKFELGGGDDAARQTA